MFMYCMHARKRASEAPRTHFRACNISKLPGGVPPDPLTYVPHIYICPGPPQSSRQPCTYAPHVCAANSYVGSEIASLDHSPGSVQFAGP